MLASLPASLIQAFSAVLGALVGSFLNVCIYRLPLEMSVRKPSRSFCPGCRRTLYWWENIPVLSWLILRARCSGCRQPISIRYPAVELLTALLFWGAAWRSGDTPDLLLAYFVLLSLLIVATFVDFDHLIIPDEVTWGGVGAGLLFAPLLPQLHGTDSRVAALGWALAGAAVGYGVLWTVAELGRLAFGRKKQAFEQAEELEWIRSGDEATLRIGNETHAWSDFFFRGTEVLRMGVVSGEMDGVPLKPGEAVWSLNELRRGGLVADLNTVDRIKLRIAWWVAPREAMGYGDVKFLAAIGAFLGWQGVLFTVMAASSLGALLGGGAALLGRREWSVRIPFGPYLALGALLWMAAGPQWVAAYWAFIMRS